MKTRVTCPHRGHLVVIEYAEDPVDGHRLGVTRCSAFRPASGVLCDELCIHRLNARDERRLVLVPPLRGGPDLEPDEAG